MVLAMGVVATNPALGQALPAGKRKAPAHAEADGAARKEAERLNQEVEKLYVDGKYDAALPLAARVLSLREKALGPDHPDVAEASNNLAELYRLKGEYANAEPLHLRALAVWEKALGPEHAHAASAVNNLACLYEDKAEYAKAEPLYQRALTIREKVLGPDHARVADSLNNLGLLYTRMGQYDKVEPLYQRALAIREKAFGSEHPDVVVSLNNLAMLYDTKGEYAKAEPLFQRALSIYEKALGPEHPRVATSLNNLASLYDTKGNHAKAELLYQRALDINQKTFGPEHINVARVLDNLAWTYRARGQYEKAELLNQRALGIWEKALGLEHPDVGISVQNLGRLYILKGDHAKAEPFIRRALSIHEKVFGPGHRNVAVSLNHLAMLYAAMGRYANAKPLFQRALSILENALGPQHPEVAESLRVITMLHWANGETLDALHSIQRATAIQERNAAVLLTTGSDDQKRLFMNTLRDGTDAVVALHAGLAPGVPEARRLALSTIVQRKGVVTDAMRDVYATLRLHAPDQTAALLKDLESINSQLGALLLRGPGPLPMEKYREMIETLRENREALEADLSKRSAEFRVEQRAITLEQVQAAIPEGAALVEILRYRPVNPKAPKPKDQWGRPRYVAYVLRRGGDITWADLGDAGAIDGAVQKLRAGLSDPDLTHDPKPSARALDALVMQPIRNLLGDNRWVFVSPDGALNLVPFAALVDEEGRYRAERYLFTYLTSGRDLLRFQALVPAKQGALIVADPAFDSVQAQRPDTKEDTHRGVRSADMSLIRFTPLPSTAQEARAIRTHLRGAEIFLGAQATEDAVRAVHGPRILHIATHGFFLPDQLDDQDRPQTVGAGLGTRELAAQLQSENPLLRSGLGLAGANARASGSHDDGILTALEVATLDLFGTKLVVLSACETGVGKTSSGEGVYGLRRSLVVSGAETQVMSLWQVDTGVTRDMMVAYYEKLERGAGRSEAMRSVQLEMLGREDRAHPNLWASFIVSGSPAALDGTFVAPDLLHVPPGVRGCACDVAGYAGTSRAANGIWLAVLAMIAAVRIPRARPRARMPVSHGGCSRRPVVDDR